MQIGENHLKIIFKSASKIGKEEIKKLSYTLPGDEKVFTRKAQYHYGWDWGPRFVTCGIYRPIKLHFWNDIKIENIRYEQVSLKNDLAKLNFIVDLNCQKSGTYLLKINDFSKSYSLKNGKNILQIPYEITNPKRWWCNGLGEANLYAFQIDISKNKKIRPAIIRKTTNRHEKIKPLCEFSMTLRIICQQCSRNRQKIKPFFVGFLKN